MSMFISLSFVPFLIISTSVCSSRIIFWNSQNNLSQNKQMGNGYNFPSHFGLLLTHLCRVNSSRYLPSHLCRELTIWTGPFPTEEVSG